MEDHDHDFDKLNTMLQHTSCQTQCHAQWVGCEMSSSLLVGGISAETGKGLYAAQDLKKDQLLFSHQLNGPSLMNMSSAMHFRKEKGKLNKNRNRNRNTFSSDEQIKLNAIISSVYKSELKHSMYAPNDFFGTTIALMVEMPFLSSSHLGAYLAWLPTCFPLPTALDRQELDSPMLWSSNELEHLQNTSVLRSLQHFESSSQQKFQDVVLSSNRLCEYLCAVGLPSDEDKWKYLKFCACVVQAYSFTINNDVDEESRNSDSGSENESEIDSDSDYKMASGSDRDSESESNSDGGYQHTTSSSINTMIPFMDAFNASNARQNVHLVIDTAHDLLECRTTCRVAAGAELFNTFGVMSSADRIIKYGYMETEDEYMLQFTLLDIVHIFEYPAWREVLQLALPDILQLYTGISTFNEHKLTSTFSKKRNRNNDNNDNDDNNNNDIITEHGLGYAIVTTVQEQWQKSGKYEEFFAAEDFKVSCLSSTCIFEVEDFLDSDDDNSDDDSDTGDNDGDDDDGDEDDDDVDEDDDDVEVETSDEDGDELKSINSNSNNSNSNSDSNSDSDADSDGDGGTDMAGDEDGNSLEQLSLFAFLNSVVDSNRMLGKEKKKKKLLVKDEENSIYFEAMFLFHLLLKHRMQSLSTTSTTTTTATAATRIPVLSSNVPSVLSTTTKRRVQLSNDIKAKEKHLLEKYLTWSQRWLRSRIIASATHSTTTTSHRHHPTSYYDQFLQLPAFDIFEFDNNLQKV